MLELLLVENAFPVLINSFIDIFPKESFGYWAGRKSNGLCTVESIFVQQNVERTSKSVDLLGNEEEALKDIECSLPYPLRVWGDDHSHPKRSNTPTSGDIKDMMQRKYWFYIIGNIYKSRKRHKWKHSPTGGILGTMRKHYVHLAAYAWDKAAGKFTHIKIDCPFAIETGYFK